MSTGFVVGVVLVGDNGGSGSRFPGAQRKRLAPTSFTRKPALQTVGGGRSSIRDTASRGTTTIVTPKSQFRTCPSDHDSIGYPRIKASSESSTTKHRLLHASGPHPIPSPNDSNISPTISVVSRLCFEQDRWRCYSGELIFRLIPFSEAVVSWKQDREVGYFGRVFAIQLLSVLGFDPMSLWGLVVLLPVLFSGNPGFAAGRGFNPAGDDENEILPTPPKRRNTGTEQPVGESSGIKKEPKEQQSPAKEEEADTKCKDITTHNARISRPIRDPQ
ncbi:hypothetical protein F511_16107 [Dorcoceras hygrometricum]|uniref:Uncharacterized protein n=1 Tax=Dorcoceras hygrometricum TaxID=472368 RepID=A0A2Z7CYX8_9LAMI|nr:hypothetical protein F511_16107 [Dorcoceras hygrometricum]